MCLPQFFHVNIFCEKVMLNERDHNIQRSGLELQYTNTPKESQYNRILT